MSARFVNIDHDTHPDHDSICKFRRENIDLLSDAFHQVLELAARASVLQVGDITVAIDKQQLVPTLAVISPLIGQVGNALVDSGYFSEAAVQTVDTGDQSPTVYAAMKRQSHGRSIAQLEMRDAPSPPPADAPVAERMKNRLDTAEAKQLYGLRKETVEPVFGIIKQAIGFLRFLLRSKDKVSIEWTLMSTSYNLKRLFSLGMKLPIASNGVWSRRRWSHKRSGVKEHGAAFLIYFGFVNRWQHSKVCPSQFMNIYTPSLLENLRGLYARQQTGIKLGLERTQALLKAVGLDPKQQRRIGHVAGMIWFRQRKVEWIQLETGLGGRLDTTNLFTPQAAIITPIGMDHQKILGQVRSLLLLKNRNQPLFSRLRSAPGSFK